MFCDFFHDLKWAWINKNPSDDYIYDLGVILIDVYNVCSVSYI